MEKEKEQNKKEKVKPKTSKVKKEKKLKSKKKKDKSSKKTTEITKQENNKNQKYFGHKEDENIWVSFLTDKMFAHRGLWDKTTPENSLGAFQKAVDAGFGIELDVSPIEDGTPVVFHDSKMSRMTGKDKYIQNLSSEELKEVKLLNSDEKIPTLEEVLKLVDGRVPLLIEIKNKHKVGDLEQAVIDLLKNYQGEYAVQSFNPYSLGYFRQHAPNILRGQLAGYLKNEKISWFKKFLLKRMHFNKKISQPNFISYEAATLPNRFVRKFKNLPLLAWSVKSKEEYLKIVKYCDNIIFEKFEPYL